MTTTDFHYAEAPTGAGAGGNTPRRLIPSHFQPTAPARLSEHWTGSLAWVAAVLTIAAAAGIGTSLALDRLFG
ncbi:MAG TPA: hypothetical protein VG795_04680 [Acidimicrobiia bacterium]|nr:hypothetical protein [Acidimicrobiia bacterium]